MIRTVEVALGPRSYPIHIGHNLLDTSADYLRSFVRNKRIIVVSDETVWAAQGARLRQGLGDVEAVPLLVPPGEGSKSWATLSRLIDRLLEAGIERRDHLVAFGGGVVGDLAGFAAAIVNRGCGLVQIPTSLLAQVDSAVGGKTGINVAAGKNLVGAFHQPSLVLIDSACLQTLSPRHRRAGYAEIVKYALIADADFMDWLDRYGPALLAGDAELAVEAIATSVAAKARIVSEDERETQGRRMLLNLGHTFAHALEAESGYSDRLLHGEAVAVGMVLAFDLSVARRLCAPSDAGRVRTHLKRAGLPVSLRELGMEASGSRLANHMKQDKKREDGRLPLILARGIGAAFVDRSVEPRELEAFLDRAD